jgi:hypothetical protein
MKTKHTLFLILCVLKCLADDPIRMGYIDELETLTPPEAMLKSMGVPGYADHEYNYLSLIYWGCR